MVVRLIKKCFGTYLYQITNDSFLYIYVDLCSRGSNFLVSDLTDLTLL